MEYINNGESQMFNAMAETAVNEVNGGIIFALTHVECRDAKLVEDFKKSVSRKMATKSRYDQVLNIPKSIIDQKNISYKKFYTSLLKKTLFSAGNIISVKPGGDNHLTNEQLQKNFESKIVNGNVKAVFIMSQKLNDSNVFEENMRRMEIIASLSLQIRKVFVFAKEDGICELLWQNPQLAGRSTIVHLSR